MKRLKRLTREKYRITALVLALCMTLSLLPISALAAGTDLAGKAIEEGTFAATGGNVNYRIDGEEIVITGGDDTVSEIVFPDEIDGKPVTRIEVSAFGNSGGHNETLTSVIFPANLTSIGGYAFHDVPGLTNIDFSKCTQSLTIGEWAFAGTSVQSVTFPEKLASIESYAFFQDEFLTSVDFSNCTELTSIGGLSAFAGTGITELTIPDCVKSIENGAFGSCEDLTSLNLGSVESIGVQAFEYTGITSLNLPDTLSEIGMGAFSFCKSLTSIDWPQNENFTILTGFDNCQALSDAELEKALSVDSVTELGYYAFDGCFFQNVTIPSNIKTIGDSAFYGCIYMASLTILPGVETIGPHTFKGCCGLAEQKVVVPATVTKIYGGAFADCTKQYDPAEGEEDFTYTGIIVEFANQDFKLTPYDSEMTSYDRVTIGDVDYEDPFAGIATIRAYETDSEGNPSMLKQFYETQKDVMDGAQKRYTFVALDGTEQTFTVSGTIHSGAKIVLYQDNQEKTVTLTDNQFSVKADAGSKVTAEVSKDGYYSKHFIRASLDGDWDLGEIAFSDGDKLPMNRVMEVDFGEAAVNSFRNLEISLKAGERELKEGTDYILQYPSVVLEDTVIEENLTLTVDADALGFTGGSVTADRETGVFELPLTAWGKLELTASGKFAGDNHILVFDKAGKLVGKSKIAKDGFYLTNGLKAGTYTVVAYNANDNFSVVASLDVLESMGLTEGIDYAKVTAEVSDGETNPVEITVPLLKTDVSGILNKEKCSVVSETSYVIRGQTFAVRVYYGFAEGKKGTVSILLPENMTLKYVCSETEQLGKDDYTASGNTVTINKTKQTGVFYLGFSCSKAGTYSLSAGATVGKTTAPIGSTSFTVYDYEIRPAAGDLNSLTGNKVTVCAAPNSDVTLLLDGEPVGKGKTNGLGNVTFTYNLPDDALPAQTFELTAIIGNERVSANVTYAKTVAVLESWNFYQTNRPYNGEYLYSASQSFYPPTFYGYLFNEEADNAWTVCAAFVGGSAPENVITYMKTLDGTVHTISMQLFKTEELTEGAGYRFNFAGEIMLPSDESGVVTEAQLPEEFSIDWVDQGEAFTYDAETAEKSQKKAAEITNERNKKSEKLAETIAETKNRYMEEYAKTNNLTYTEDPNFDVSEYIFGAKYRASETMPEWFAKQTPEVQAAFYNAEKAIDEAMESFSEMMGLKKNITEYSSWEEVYADMGITMKENTRTAEELRADGFEVCENADGTFIAFKDYAEESAEVQEEFKPVALRAVANALMKTTNTSLAREGGVSGITGGFAFIDADGNEIDYNGEAAGNFDQGVRNAFIGCFGNATEALNQVMHLPGVTDSQLALNLTEGMSTTVGLVGAATGIEGAMQDTEAYVDYTVREADMQGYIDELKMFEERYKDKPLCSNAIMRERFVAMDLRLYMGLEKDRYYANSWVGSIFTVVGAADKTPITTGLSAMWDGCSNATGVRRAAEITRLSAELDRLTRERKQKCDDTDMERIMKKTQKIQPVMDPSGIVYEAVESNTVSGVTATVWYAEDAQGTNAQVWDAENYEQINPQITDNSGMFAWDVPIGWWQVRFEKEGYESTATEWMQVPPPRMGLKIAMKSTEKPVVSSVGAYPDYIEVIFSQYMDTAKEITLPADMTGTWQSVDSGYSKILHITKAGGFQKGSTVSFTLDGAQNYAGKAFAFYNSGELTVSARPAELILDYESVIFAKAGTEKEITVRVKDSEGNYMEGVTVEAELGNTLIAALNSGSEVTDAEGKTVFTADALLPGYTDITFRAAGTSLEKTLTFRAALEERRPKRPTAAIGETQFGENSPKENYITVKGGEQLVISAEDGVTIYYTTDDTCPCQNSSSRKIYTNPIPITENTKFRIAAYRDGMDYSERLNITVTVDDTHQHSYGSEWKSDENGHWHECSCGAVSDRAEHDWKVENAKEATATESGYTGDKTCKVCGYEMKGEEIPAKGTTEPSDPANSDDDNPTNPVNPDNDKPTNPNGDGNQNTNSPQTGDNSNLWMWFAVLFISGGMLVGTTVYFKKKKCFK
ncbi:MAG: leucine-rich repeat protein [Lachnospiraceae bacterium]